MREEFNSSYFLIHFTFLSVLSASVVFLAGAAELATGHMTLEK